MATASERKEAAQGSYNKLLKYPSATTGLTWGEKKWYWVPNKAEGFIAGEVIKEDGKECLLRLGTGEEVKYPMDKVTPMNPPKFDGCEDCAELSHLNEASVLHNLRKRYDHDLIYTNSGLFLVAVNPYKRIPIYTPEMINIFRGRRRNEVAPHIFAVADESYRMMLNNREDQSMLITGESGAGKTENTKKVIQYIAFVAGRATASGLGELEQQLLECNPLLESFGNAKTNRNDNSSRFGKFIRLQFTSGGQVAGASIRQYLLEKNRVVFQNKGERSFHIFYQVTNGMTNADDRKKFLMDKPEKFKFLSNSGCSTVNGIDDSEEFKATKHAMDLMNVSPADQESFFKVVCGILWLGNIKFESNKDLAEVRDKTPVNNAAKLLDVDPAGLETSLIKPRIKAGTEIVSTHLTAEKADYSRNALAKALYGKLFACLVKKVNVALEKENQNHFIGVLDIAGFEIFEFNTFEQMCINYTNERLQQFFNNHMFKLEQEEYMREEINWTFVDFGMDSQDRIDLIDKKPIGILALLEEESFFPKATDDTFLAKVTGAHSRNAYFKKPKFAKGTFRLAHYAGEVEYDTKGWLEKNRDPLQEDLEIVMKKSKSPFIADLFSEEFKNQDVVVASAAGKKGQTASGLSGQLGRDKRKGAMFVTVSTHHKEQLNDLMDTLYATSPHFVRCILPNHEKRPGFLEADIVLEQLRCNGVLEGIRICRKGFPNRLVYAEFLKRYYLINDKVNKNDADPRKATEQLMKASKMDPEQFRFGLTKIFFRAGALAKIEELREQRIGQFLTHIQAASRGWLGRRLVNKLKLQAKAAKIIQRSMRAWTDFQTWGWYQAWMKAKPIIDMMYWESTFRKKKAELETIKGEIAGLATQRKALDDKINTQKLTIEGILSTLQQEKANKDQYLADKDALEKARDDAEKRIDQLKRDLEAEELERRETNAMKTRKAAQADELDAELKRETKARQQLEILKRENEAKIAELQGNIQAAEDKISRLETAKRNLERELEELKESLDGESDAVGTLDRQKRNLLAEIDQLKDDLDKFTTDNAALNNQKRALQSQLDDCKTQINDTRAAKEAHDAAAKLISGEINDLRDTITKKQKGSDESGKSIKKVEDDIASAKSQLNEEREAKANLDKNKRRLETELSDLTSKLSEETSARSTLEDAKRNNEAELAKLKVQLEQAQAKILTLEKARAALEQQAADLQSRCEKEAADKDVLLKANKRLQQELDDTLAKMGDRGAHRAEVDRVRNQLTKQYNDVNAEYNNVRQARDDADKKVRALETELIELKTQEGDLTGKITTLSVQVKASDGEVADLRANLQAAVEAREKAEKRRRQVEEEYKKLKDEVESEIGGLKEKLEEGRKLIEAELADIRRRLDDETAARGKAESARKAVERELAEQTHLLEEKEAIRFNLERAKQKLEADLAELRTEEDNEQALVAKLTAAKTKLDEQVNSNRDTLAALAGSGVDTETVKRKEAELIALREQHAKEVEDKTNVEKAKRVLEGELRNLKADLDEQNSAKSKAERSKRDLEDEADKLSELFGGAASSTALEEIRRRNDAEINSLTEKLKTETELREKAEESRRALVTEVSDLKTKVTETESDRSAAGRLAKKLEADVDDRNSAYKTESAEKLRVEKALKKLERELKGLQGRDGAGRKGVDETEILKLEDELADLRDKTEAAKKTREELEGKNKGLSKEVAEARATAESSQLVAGRGQSQKAALEEQIRKLKEKLDAVELNKAEVEEAVRAQEDSLVNSRKQLESAKTNRTKAEADAKDAAAQLDKLKKDIEAEKSGKGNVDRDTKRLAKELDDLRARVDTEKRNRDKSEKAREKAEKDFKEAQRKLQAAELARSDIELQTKKLVEEATAGKKSIEDKRKENDRLESLRKDLDRQLKEARTQTDDERRQRQRAEAAKKTSETEVEAAKDRVRESEKSKNTLEDSTAQQNSELGNLKQEVDTLSLARGKIDELIKDMERDVRELKDRLANVDRERQGASSERRVLEESLNEFKDKLAISTRKAETLEKQIEGVEKELESVREKSLARGPSSSEKSLRLEADNKSLQDKIDEESDKVIVKEGEKKELQAQLATLRTASNKIEEELILLKDNLTRERKATAELQSRLEGFFVTLGKTPSS